MHSTTTTGHNPFDPNSRLQKVDKIFRLFDANGDGYLNREEMASLVMAVNPRVRFTDAQINAILTEVFRSYGEFIAGDKGLRQDGLLRTYNDGAGDIDRDFDALGLRLDGDDDAAEDDEDGASNSQQEEDDDPEPEQQQQQQQQQHEQQQLQDGNESDRSAASSVGRRFSSNSSSMIRSKSSMSMIKNSRVAAVAWAPSWTASPSNGITYADTWHIVEDLDTLIRRAEAKIAARRAIGGGGGGGATAAAGELLGADFASFQRTLMELGERADCSRTQDEAFDAHMAMGRTLFDHGFLEEAMARFRRATELRPTDVRPYFRSGNSLCSLGRFSEAGEAFSMALDAATSNGPLWAALVPQIHVNSGVALEGQGMLLGACDHYREAAILSPAHHRALKLLGSALLGAGEFGAAELALREAVALKPDYADAHCDLASAIAASAASSDSSCTKAAIQEYQRAIQLQPQHVDALYNLAGLLRDTGSFSQAADMYARVIALQPLLWQAHLNRAVALLGMGQVEAATAAMKQAFKLTNRVEIYDEINHLKRMQQQQQQQQQHHNLPWSCIDTKSRGAGAAGAVLPPPPPSAMIPVVDPSRFLRSSTKTTPSVLMRCALDMRDFQKTTRLNRCSVSLLVRDILDDPKLPLSSNKCMRKADLERVLRTKLLPFLSADAFAGTIKCLNSRAMSLLLLGAAAAAPTAAATAAAAASEYIDVGMLLAIVAPICAGSLDRRKRAAFDALVWRGPNSKRLGAETSRADVNAFLRNLKLVYMGHSLQQQQQQQQQGKIQDEDEDEQADKVSYPEFVEMLEETKLVACWDASPSFGEALETVVKLESGDRSRHGGMACNVCSYEISGPRFKEVSAGFSLCSVCYSQGKVPPDYLHEDYFCFKEYASEADAMREKLALFGSKLT